MSGKFQEVTAELAQALDSLPWDQLDVSVEVREQVNFYDDVVLYVNTELQVLFSSAHLLLRPAKIANIQWRG